MFKVQMVFLESSYILTLISVANVFGKCSVSDILRYIKIIVEMQIFMTHWGKKEKRDAPEMIERDSGLRNNPKFPIKAKT